MEQHVEAAGAAEVADPERTPVVDRVPEAGRVADQRPRQLSAARARVGRAGERRHLALALSDLLTLGGDLPVELPDLGAVHRVPWIQAALLLVEVGDVGAQVGDLA